MKKQIVFLALLILAGAATYAQNAQRRTVEERVKSAMEIMTPALGLDKTAQSHTDTIFINYYKAMDKLRETMQPGTAPDRGLFEKVANDRDEALKKVLSADQFKKFKDEVEASLRPQRRQQ